MYKLLHKTPGSKQAHALLTMLGFEILASFGILYFNVFKTPKTHSLQTEMLLYLSFFGFMYITCHAIFMIHGHREVDAKAVLFMKLIPLGLAVILCDQCIDRTTCIIMYGLEAIILSVLFMFSRYFRKHIIEK